LKQKRDISEEMLQNEDAAGNVASLDFFPLNPRSYL
jgi:hypothetical protein